MPRINDYVQLAAQTAREIAADGETWRSFLQTASTLFKYGFYDQMMIYAQRPDATACASFELWTNTMRRYVRRGADPKRSDRGRGQSNLPVLFRTSQHQ